MENQTNTGKTLRVFNCQGLAIEIGDTLMKMQDNVLEIPFEAEIAHIETDKGKILCTVLNNKNIYESGQNTDRRKHNIDNGFEVFWDEPGLECTIYGRKKASQTPGWLTLLISFLAGGAIAAALFLCLYHPEESERGERNQVISYAQGTELTNQLIFYFDQLQSLETTEQDVDNLISWYNGLKQSEKRFLFDELEVDVEAVIMAYSTFYYPDSYEDLLMLAENYGGFFTSEQLDVMKYGYGRDSDTFESWRDNFGMSFSEPYRRGLMY